MLSRFRRPEADLQIRVDQSELHPDDELEARVTLIPRSDFSVRKGKVELICTETRVQTTRTQYGVSYGRKTDDLFRLGETLLDNTTVRKGLSHSTNVRLTVPPDALPTVHGTPVEKIHPGISWEVEVSLDVAGARDIHQSQEIRVIRVPTSENVPHRPVVAEERYSQCALTLTLSSEEARSGDRIDGTLRAEMLQEVGVSEVRVELVREEKFGNESQDHVVDTLTVERETSLVANRTLEWRFRLDTGRVEVPSLETEKSSVRWLVKGILARRMRTDLRVEQEITVDF